MLDIRDYDMAFVERIKSFYKNTHWINRQSIPIKEIRDHKLLCGCDVDFPLLVVRRVHCPIFSTEYNSWARAKSGQTFATADGTGYRKVQDYDMGLANKLMKDGNHDALSVVNSTFILTYYIDVIALERDNFDTLVVELQENLFRIPFLDFNNIKSNGDQDRIVQGQACHIKLEEIEDTSDLENFDSGNSLYRATLTIKLNAYIYRKYRAETVNTFNITTQSFPSWLKDTVIQDSNNNGHGGNTGGGSGSNSSGSNGNMSLEDFINTTGITSIEDYLLSDYVTDKIHDAGYDTIYDYIESLGYDDFSEFIDAFNKGELPNVIIDLSIGPSGVILVFNIPPKKTEEPNND